MAIINMGSAHTYETGVRELRTVFHDGEYCPMPTPGGMNAERQGDTLFETYAGCCISEYERNGYDDSDFFMVVWDEETQATKSVMFATTRGWCYPCFGSRPDATPEVMAKVEAYNEAQRIKAEAYRAEINEQAPHKGDTVLINGFTRGKHAPLNGKAGEVFWIGPDQYKRHGFTIGVKVDGEKFFIPADRAFKGDVCCDEGIRRLNAYKTVRSCF